MIIQDARVDDDQLTLTFDFGRLTLSDQGQCCCESRWMSTDDDVRSLIGGRFLCYEIKDGPDEWQGTNDEVHETQFLEIQTDKGFITLVTHNEHNGYYGGFSIEEQWSAL